MENLQRRCLDQGSISLIYGAQGTGKTRLIQQFINTRLYDRKVVFCTMTEQGFKLLDDDIIQEFTKFQSLVQEQLKEHSVFIVDQLEQAPESAIHQLLQLWSVSANHGLSLILLCRAKALGTLFAISEQLNIKIPSEEIKRFNRGESMQYLAAQLCNDNGMIPVLSTELRRQLDLAAGVPALLEQLIQQNAGQIRCHEPGSKIPKLSLVVAAVFVVICLPVVVDLYQSGFQEIENPPIENSVMGSITANPSIQTHPATNSMQEKPNQLNSSDLLRHEMPPIEPQLEPEKIEIVQQENTDAELDKEEGHSTSESDRLQGRFSATRQWLENSPASTSTIQLMSLQRARDAESTLTRLLDKLDKSNIDLQQVYIYVVEKPVQPIYVILYGSFASMSIAYQQIEELPASLKENAPLVRTVGGINKELNREAL